jgi:hypothetical protein
MRGAGGRLLQPNKDTGHHFISRSTAAVWLEIEGHRLFCGDKLLDGLEVLRHALHQQRVVIAIGDDQYALVLRRRVSARVGLRQT